MHVVCAKCRYTVELRLLVSREIEAFVRTCVSQSVRAFGVRTQNIVSHTHLFHNLVINLSFIYMKKCRNAHGNIELLVK